MTMETPGTTRKTFSYRRLSKVCARCKKRKTKCDFNFPSCGPCKKAGAVCQGYNSVAETEVPRSLVRSLEDQVAQLESQVEKFRQSKDNLPGMFASIISKATLSIGLSPSRSFFHSTVSSALFLHPSCPPLPVARSQAKRFSRQARRPSSSLPSQQKHQLRQATSSTNLKTVPYAAIDHMVKNYTNIHLPQYPCILEPWLHQVLKRVLEEKSGDTDLVLSQGISADSGLGHFDYFVVFIILAISSLTLTWRNESQAVAASDSFCASALNHLQLITEVDEIQGLQASLLLAHYAHMNPEKADNWICISNATKIVLDLGLHIKPAKMLDPEQAQLRCQLFRVTYGMERSMCGILRLPLSFPEESITVEFDMASIDGTYLDEAQRKESSANHIYLYRALETESHRVLHLQEEVQTIQGKTIPEWVQDITSRLEIWYEKAKGFSVHQMLEFRDVQYSHLRARLHRPTPRLRTRTPEDRQICLEACQMLVEDYQRQVKHRRLFYPWHGCHILFEAAVIMLDACWCSRDWEPHRQQARFILSITLPDCLTLLSKVGERWHEAALCAEHLRPVVHEVTKAFNDRITQDVDMNAEQAEAVTTEKLKQLLFPDGPLAWNARTDGGGDADGSVNGSGGGSQGTADVGFGSLSGLEGFQWDARWDLADILYGSLDPNVGLV